MKKILIIQNKRIGDVLISTVIADNLKRIYPNCDIHFFAYDYTTGVIENHNHIDRIISVNEKWLKPLFNLVRMSWRIRKKKYDVIFDPYSKFQSQCICFLSTAKYKIGYKKKDKKPFLRAYTHYIPLLKKSSKACGKSIEDKVNMVSSVFQLQHPSYVPQIHLTQTEHHYEKLIPHNDKPIVVVGVMGSTIEKSMPLHYMAELIDFVASNFNVYIIFNYAPHQKKEAQEIFDSCKMKNNILFDIYEKNIRGFIQMMNASALLISNEGGAVHIAKALKKPTFTIYSPYILRESWASFEDDFTHTSVHLLDYKPNSFQNDKETRKKIENNPSLLYKEFKPKIFLDKLHKFLSMNLSKS